MSQSGAPLQPKLFASSGSATCQGDNMYSFYGISFGTTNYINYTYYSGGSWGQTALTGPSGKVSTAPAPVANADIQSILVGNDVCVVYPSSDTQLVVITSTGSNTFEKRAEYNAGTAFSSFCICTDGTYLYLVTNQGGILYSHRLNNNAFDSKTQLNGTGGQTSTPDAINGSVLGAGMYYGKLHCAYRSASKVVHIFQTISGWDSSEVYAMTSAQYRSFDFFIEDNKLYIVVVDYNGEVWIGLYLAGNSDPWSEAYVTNSPTPSGGAAVGVTALGVFIVYMDLTGRMWCVHRLKGKTAWANVQISGPGAASYFVPSAPLSIYTPCVTVYKNLAFHAIYNDGPEKLYDVYWAFGWAGETLYPTTPSAGVSMENLEEKDAQMMP